MRYLNSKNPAENRLELSLEVQRSAGTIPAPKIHCRNRISAVELGLEIRDELALSLYHRNRLELGLDMRRSVGTIPAPPKSKNIAENRISAVDFGLEGWR